MVPSKPMQILTNPHHLHCSQPDPATIISCLDYCNSFLTCLSVSTLQLILNIVAWVNLLKHQSFYSPAQNSFLSSPLRVLTKPSAVRLHTPLTHIPHDALTLWLGCSSLFTVLLSVFKQRIFVILSGLLHLLFPQPGILSPHMAAYHPLVSAHHVSDYPTSNVNTLTHTYFLSLHPA